MSGRQIVSLPSTSLKKVPLDPYSYSCVGKWISIFRKNWNVPYAQFLVRVSVILLAHAKALYFNLCLSMSCRRHHCRATDKHWRCSDSSHPMSPCTSLLGVNFPTPRKYLHALFCTVFTTEKLRYVCPIPQIHSWKLNLPWHHSVGYSIHTAYRPGLYISLLTDLGSHQPPLQRV